MEDILQPFHIITLQVDTNQQTFRAQLFLAFRGLDMQPTHRMI